MMLVPDFIPATGGAGAARPGIIQPGLSVFVL